MDWLHWYDGLAKPAWTPAPATIRTIWSILYPIIAVSFGYVFVQAWRGKLPPLVALPFALNFAANLAFMPIMAGLRNSALASADIAAVLATLGWAMAAVWPHARWVALVQLPYFAWTATAATLQFTITAMNWRSPPGLH